MNGDNDHGQSTAIESEPVGIVDNESRPLITADGQDLDEAIQIARNAPPPSQHHSLKHHLLGPSLTKAGQDAVDFKKVAEVIYDASKGSKFFNNEEVKDKNLTFKIDRILKHKAQLEKLDLKQDLRRAEAYIEELELSRDLSQYVVHIDCDAFYAAVEEIDRPELKTVPMAVGVGVVTTCNYEARKYGVRSAMAGFVAKKLCPQLISLPLRFEKYTAKAREVRAILAEYDPDFESSSIDEAYMNVTQYCLDHEMDPDTVLQQLRQEVSEKCKVTISAGIAPNAKIAKICSNKNKPNGQFRLPNDRASVMAFMKELPVRKVNGIGRVLERELDAIGVKTCGDLYDHRAYLNRLFGEKTYQFLIQTYLGLGRTDVTPAEDHERKSVGTESTFRDISSKGDLRAKLRHTAEKLEKDLRRVGVKGRTLCLKVKLHTYEVFTRQVIPPKAIQTADELYNFSLPMLATLEKEMPDFRLRLMGLRCTHLVSTKKPDVEGFFKRKPGANLPIRTENNLDGEWEVWPDTEFEEAARLEKQEEMDELHRLSQENQDGDQDGDHSGDTNAYPGNWDYSTAEWHEPFGAYKYGSATNSPEKRTPQKKDEILKEEYWYCPICELAQPANDKDFNSHIDLCLSKQTIREAVAETTNTNNTATKDEEGVKSTSSLSTPDPDLPSRPRSANGVKRKATNGNSVAGLSKQRKLFFA